MVFCCSCWRRLVLSPSHELVMISVVSLFRSSCLADPLRPEPIEVHERAYPDSRQEADDERTGEKRLGLGDLRDLKDLTDLRDRNLLALVGR